MHLLGGHDREVVEWASAVLDKRFVEPVAAFGIVDSTSLLRGAVLFNDYYPGGNIEMTYVGRGTITRRVIRGLAKYAFEACEVSRITAKTHRSNVTVRRLLPRLGFSFERADKRYFGPKRADDALVFVLYRNRIPEWMKGSP